MKRHNLLFVSLLFISTLLTATETETSTRVVGGEDSIEGDWPWVVSVRSSIYSCGGSLINENTVMTAAHCLHDSNNDPIPASDINVIVGEYDISSISSSSYVAVSSTYIHSGYDPAPNVSSNDIALLRLASSVTDIAPIDRADVTTTTAAIAAKEYVTILGWGSTVGYAVGESVTPEYPRILQQADLPLQTDSQCDRTYSVFNSTSMLCAGEDVGGVDSCQGDSGGPLIYNNGGSWEQMGIVSFGSGCANAGYPGVYTRVAVFNDWIEDYLSTVSIDDELAFTLAVPDSSQTQELAITNNTKSTVTLTFTLTGSSEFSFNSHRCAIILSNESCSLSITYSPSSLIPSAAMLVINSEQDDDILLTTLLTGTPLLSSSLSSGGGSILFLLLCMPLSLLRHILAKNCLIFHTR